MDNDFIKVPPRIDINERECDTKKEGYVEAPGSEVPKISIRKSSRLQIKKTLSSCSQDIFRSYHSSSKYAMKSSKASLQRKNFISESKLQKENKHQFPIRNENNGVSADTAAMKSSTAVPSFKYHVQSKDGIQIVVDLNLKRSDWLKSLEKTVCVCQNPKPEFESFRKEVESLGDRNKSNNLKFSSTDKSNASDASMNSYVPNNFPLKSTSREIGKTLPSVVEKEVIIVSGSKRRWLNVDQNSEVVTEKCENTKMQENCSPNTDCRENVAFSSEDIKFSEFSSHQKYSSCSRTVKACSETLLINTTEVNQEAGGNHKRSTVENGERINFAKGMELSGREENALVTSAFDDGPKRKKLDHNSNHINGQSHERILRSTKMFGAQILEHGGLFIRRSSRLFSK